MLTSGRRPAGPGGGQGRIGARSSELEPRRGASGMAGQGLERGRRTPVRASGPGAVRPVRKLAAPRAFALKAGLVLAALVALVAGAPLASPAVAQESPAATSPLAPAATGSPLETLDSFHRLSSEAAAHLFDAFYRAETEGTGLFSETEEVRTLKAEAITKLLRATTTLDLSNVAPANRRTVGINSVLLLEEILSRLPPPDPEAIPDEADVDAGEAVRGFTLPGTEIQMLRSEDLSGEPRYLFSPETVRRLPAFYRAIRDLPRTSGTATGEVDFYQHFVSAPGLSMPIQLYRYILDLPQWALSIHYEQALWQWIALALLTVVYGGLAYLVLRSEVRQTTSSEGVAASLHRLLVPVIVIAFLGVYRWLCDDVINLTGDVLTYVELAAETLQTFALAVLVLFAFNFLAALIISSPRISKESLDASLIRLVLRVIGLVAAGFIVFLGASRIGLPVYGIVAGLGVGGLAIALAVRPTLENFVGGIILYADRPVKVGDFCQFGNMLGTVEEIGLRSTKVRSLNRTLVTVQNSEFSQLSITNFSRRDANLMQTTIRLRHETTVPQLTAIITAIAEMLRGDARVDAETVRVVFLEIADTALDVEVRAYINTADYTRFLKIKEELLINIMAIVEEHGTAFAKPSQTTYLAHDHGPGAAQDGGPETGRNMADLFGLER